MTTISTVFFFLLLSIFTLRNNVFLVNAQSETYLYTIYYEERGCGRSAVSLVGHSSGDDEFSVGGWDNYTDMCSLESTCLVNNVSDICQEHLVRTSSSWNRADIDNSGRVFECDSTNDGVDQPVCRFLEGCGNSSKYPNCSFQLATTSDLFKNPDLIRNDNPFENDGLSMTNYLMLYSDNSCSELEGVKGIVAGDTALPITPEDMSCEAAVACSLYPAGEQCATNGGTTGDVFTFRTKPAESKAIVCLDENEEHCVEIDPKECIKSEVYPSCWYHLVTAKRLFAEPDAYIVGTKYVSADAPVTGGQAAPAIAPAGAPPSGVITSGPTPVGGEPLPADDSSSHLWGNVMSVVALVLFTLMTLLD